MRKVGVTAVITAAISVAAGCGSSSKGGNDRGKASGPQVIRTAYAAPIAGGIDPASFYAVEGNSVILSVYETLLTYKPGTAELAPSLAKSWKVSPDGMTYTFDLREGVKFHDGAPLDAKAVKASFERTIALKGGPSYMLADVKSIRTPDPMQVVVKLGRPVGAFLHYNASMYGPKVVSPKALRANAGKDQAAKWLSTNAVGSGPFKLASYKPAGPILLERFDSYWGEKAKPQRVQISIVPNIGDQLLQLRSGQLDLLTSGVDARQLPGLEKDPALQIETFDDAIIRPVLMLNTRRAPFDDLLTRRALFSGLDSSAAVERVYGDAGDPAKSVLPPELLSPELDPLPDPGAPTKAPTDRTITLSYTSQVGELRQIGEVLQQSLERNGWKVRLRADSIEAQFGFAAAPDKAPDALVAILNPDAAHPGAWMDPIYGSAGGINVLHFADKGVDEQLAAAGAETDAERAKAKYAAAAKTAGETFYALPLAEKADTVVASKDLTGFSHVPTYIYSVDFADLSK